MEYVIEKRLMGHVKDCNLAIYLSKAVIEFLNTYADITGINQYNQIEYTCSLPKKMQRLFVRVRKGKYKHSIGVITGFDGHLRAETKNGKLIYKKESILHHIDKVYVKFDDNGKSYKLTCWDLEPTKKQPIGMKTKTEAVDMFGAPIKVGDAVVARSGKYVVFGNIKRITAHQATIDAFHVIGSYEANNNYKLKTGTAVPFNDIAMLDSDILTRMVPKKLANA